MQASQLAPHLSFFKAITCVFACILWNYPTSGWVPGMSKLGSHSVRSQSYVLLFISGLPVRFPVYHTAFRLSTLMILRSFRAVAFQCITLSGCCQLMVSCDPLCWCYQLNTFLSLCQPLVSSGSLLLMFPSLACSVSVVNPVCFSCWTNAYPVIKGGYGYVNSPHTINRVLWPWKTNTLYSYHHH